MKKIYKTELKLIKDWVTSDPCGKLITKKCSLSMEYYSDFYYEIEDSQKEFVLNNKIETYDLKDYDLVKINDSNQSFYVPRIILDNTIYVTKTIFHNVYKEIVTGRKFVIYPDYLSESTLCVLSTYCEPISLSDDYELKKLKVYLLNKEAIKNKIENSITITKKMYDEAKGKIRVIKEKEKEEAKKYKDQKRMVKNLQKENIQDLKRLLK